jgi:hypothetical protein
MKIWLAIIERPKHFLAHLAQRGPGELLPSLGVLTQKPAILPYSIFSNSGHVGWCLASPDTILKLDTLVMIQTKIGFNWSVVQPCNF